MKTHINWIRAIYRIAKQRINVLDVFYG